MLKNIKNFFLVDMETGSLPTLLSSFTLTLLGVLAAALILSPATIRSHELAQLIGGPTFEKADVIRLVNASRSEAGLPSLKENDVLDFAAETKAEDMTGKDYFAHNSPDGKTPWDFIRGAGYKYAAAGENLALDYTTAESAHAALMASPTHRANILNKLYTEIGVSVVPGNYEGRPAIFLVQYFGKPLSPIVQVPKLTDLSGAKSLAKLPAASKTGTEPKAKQEVLGTQVKLPTITISDQPIPGTDVPVRFLGFFVTFLLLTTLALALIRLGALPFGIMAKTFALILIFGYIATHNVVVKETPKQITPISFSTANPSSK